MNGVVYQFNNFYYVSLYNQNITKIIIHMNNWKTH